MSMFTMFYVLPVFALAAWDCTKQATACPQGVECLSGNDVAKYWVQEWPKFCAIDNPDAKQKCEIYKSAAQQLGICANMVRIAYAESSKPSVDEDFLTCKAEYKAMNPSVLAAGQSGATAPTGLYQIRGFGGPINQYHCSQKFDDLYPAINTGSTPTEVLKHPDTSTITSMCVVMANGGPAEDGKTGGWSQWTSIGTPKYTAFDKPMAEQACRDACSGISSEDNCSAVSFCKYSAGKCTGVQEDGAGSAETIMV